VAKASSRMRSRRMGCGAILSVWRTHSEFTGPVWVALRRLMNRCELMVFGQVVEGSGFSAEVGRGLR
jgi:hypothetical protein